MYIWLACHVSLHHPSHAITTRTSWTHTQRPVWCLNYTVGDYCCCCYHCRCMNTFHTERAPRNDSQPHLASSHIVQHAVHWLSLSIDGGHSSQCSSSVAALVFHGMNGNKNGGVVVVVVDVVFLVFVLLIWELLVE